MFTAKNIFTLKKKIHVVLLLQGSKTKLHSIPSNQFHGGPIELFLVPANAPQLV